MRTYLPALCSLAMLASVGCRSVTKNEPLPADTAAVHEPSEPAPPAVVEFNSNGALVAKDRDIYYLRSLTRRFDVVERTWATLPSPRTTGRIHLGAGVAGEHILSIGGTASLRDTDVIEVLDTRSRTWERRGRLPEPLSMMATVASADGKVYLFGGRRVLDARLRSYDTESVNTVYVIEDEGRSVRRLADMPTPRQLAAAVVVGADIWVLGGSIARANVDRAQPPATSVVEIFHPETNTWREGPAMPKSSEGHAVHLDGTLVFFGDGPLWPKEPMLLDIQAGSWQLGARRDTKTIGSVIAGAVVIDHTIHVMSGVIPGGLQPKEAHICTYDPDKDAWQVLQ